MMPKKSKSIIYKISSKYILRNIFSFLDSDVLLKIVKFNKAIQKKLDILFQNALFSYRFKHYIKNLE